MAIEFTCKNCDTTLRVPDEHAGKQAKCPRCQTLNLIQAGVASTPFAGPSSDLGGPSSSADSLFRDIPQAKPASTPAPVSNPYQPGGGGYRQQYQVAHRGPLVLILGIFGLICNMFAIPGILAWVFGRADLKQMDAGIMDPEGRGMTMAGMIMGIIGTAFVGMVILIYGGLAVLVFIAALAGA